jgi:aspartate/methionine/tyrosine aminotransferase
VTKDYAAARVRGFGTSVFTEMSRLANEHGAVNLGQGFPDFPGPDFVKTAAKTAIDTDLNQYAISHGAPRLRAAIARSWRERFDLEIDEDCEITVTSGATEAVYDAIQALVGPGDEVVVFEPFYDSYLPSVTMAGATLRTIELRAPDWTFEPAEAEAAFGPRTRMLLLNTPHNPTGKVFTRQELTLLARLCQDWDVVALTDEVYDRILFDDAEHVPLATLPGMWERTLTINSTGKTFSMTGWKVGFAVGPPMLNEILRSVHQYVTFATATPFQDAMASAMEEATERGYYDELNRDYALRRDGLRAALEFASLPTLAVGGAYFLMADVSGLGFADDVEFCRWLTVKVGVAAVPPSAFYLDPTRAPLLARFCFAKREETIQRAAERLAAIPAMLERRTECSDHDANGTEGGIRRP